MTGDLAEFEEGSLALPPCCRVPRELMRQVEENQAGPREQRKTLASCARWLESKGYIMKGPGLRDHLINGHASRLDD